MFWMVCKDKNGSLWLMRVKSRRSGIETLREVFKVEPVRCKQLHSNGNKEYFVKFSDLCKELDNELEMVAKREG